MNPGTSQWPAVMGGWAQVFPDYERFAHPIRNYTAYTLTANKRFADNWLLNASYTYSFLKGNYEGGSGGYRLTASRPMSAAPTTSPRPSITTTATGTCRRT